MMAQIVAQNNYWTAIFYEDILGFIILVHRTLWFEELALAAGLPGNQFAGGRRGKV